MKREFLMLAHKYEPAKHTSIGLWYMSEKLDGMRAFWDGGITRGTPANEVPFANVEKDERYINPVYATGLWSRYGKAIQAPNWWLDEMPVGIPLDGELYMGAGQFQQLSSCVKQLNPDQRWQMVRYKVFDTPPYHIIFGDGRIDTTNFKKTLKDVYYKFTYRELSLKGSPQFAASYAWLRDNLPESRYCQLHHQEMLPLSKDAIDRLHSCVNTIVENGGEGAMIRNPSSVWLPERCYGLLKVKLLQDDEAEVIGYVWGRETELGSKLLGLMGAMIVRWNGKIFELSGFTDEERRLYHWMKQSWDAAKEEGYKNAGLKCGVGITNLEFPIGSKVTFKYRELSNDNIPKEARYYRKA